MKSSKYCLLMALTVFFIACQPSKEKLITKIKQHENELIKNTSGYLDKANAEKMIGLYAEYIEQYPNDSTTADFIFKSAEIYMNMGESYKSIDLLNKLIKNYSNYRNIANAYFLKGFIYDTQIKDFKQAAVYYQMFIEKFPDHPLVNDTRVCIRNLGKSDEELIREFEAKNKSIQDSINKIAKK